MVEQTIQPDDPLEMLERTRNRNDSRKCRVFAATCCHRIWPHLSEGLRAAVIIAEQVAVGSLDEGSRIKTAVEVRSCCIYVDGDSAATDRLQGFAAEAVLNALFGDDDYPPIPTYSTTCAIAVARAVQEVVYAESELCGATPKQCEVRIEAERLWQCENIRQIFGTLP